MLFDYNDSTKEISNPLSIREHDSMVLSVAAGKETNTAVTGSHDS